MKLLTQFSEMAVSAITANSLFNGYCDFVKEFEIDSCAYGEVNNSIYPTNVSTLKNHPSLINYPKPWVCHYEENSLQNYDPVIKRAGRLTKATYWSDFTEPLDDAEQGVLNTASDFGISYGIVMPFWSQKGTNAFLSTSRSTEKKLSPTSFAKLQAMGMVFYSRLQHIKSQTELGKQNKTLTKRQLECMYWIIRGKSSWDISKIINVSENTVNYHVKQVLRHFETSSRTAAAIQCIELGLLKTD